jgi:hypothetical protein
MILFWKLEFLSNPFFFGIFIKFTQWIDTQNRFRSFLYIKYSMLHSNSSVLKTLMIKLTKLHKSNEWHPNLDRFPIKKSRKSNQWPSLYLGISKFKLFSSIFPQYYDLKSTGNVSKVLSVCRTRYIIGLYEHAHASISPRFLARFKL